MRELTEKFWDVIVIGTGMGGGTVGRALAERGLSVLFVEKGPSGLRREETRLSTTMADIHARKVRGFWPLPIERRFNGCVNRFFAPLGSGVGGSSVFYAATLERPEPHDLDHTPQRPHPSGGWPVTYESFLPYFRAAEEMYDVCGDPDPLSSQSAEHLRTPPAISATDQHLFLSMRSAGLHPYRLHSAIRYRPGCQDCLGKKCPRDCKMDSRSAGVEPALRSGNAALLEGCEAVRLLGGSDRVTGILVRHSMGTTNLKCKIVVLAAGAYNSPRLLLASASQEWPAGCANTNGLVGRNLMFHLNERIAIWPRNRLARDVMPSKAIGLRDLYYSNGHRFGMIQSMGLSASYGDIVQYFDMRLDRSRLRDLKAPKIAARLIASAAAHVLGKAQMFVGLLEDLPYTKNRVLPPQEDEVIRFEYHISDELAARRKLFRRAIRRALCGHRHLLLTLGPELNTGHPCGTLRMGCDPANSVVDAQCCAHGFRNLFVVDASVFPTSMGVNPSLTIAANALRVAPSILEAAQSATGATS